MKEQARMRALSALCAATLAACGGGGDGGETTAAAGPPTSGTSSPSASGPSANPPSAPATAPVAPGPSVGGFTAFSPTEIGTGVTAPVATLSVPQPPVVARLASGGGVAAWSSGTHLQAQAFDNLGRANGPRVDVATLSSTLRNYAVAGLSNGDWVVAWVDVTIAGFGREATETLQLRRYSSAGQLVQDTTQVNGAFFSVFTPIAIAPSTDGGFAIAWSANLSLFPPSAMFQRFTAAGAPAGPPTNVAGASGAMTQAHLVTLGDGTLVVLWLQASADNTTRTVTMQHFDASGSALTGAIPIAASTAAGDSTFDAAALPDGSIAIAWNHATGQQPAPQSVSWQIVDAAGTARTAAGSSAVGATVEGVQVAPAADGFLVFTQLSTITGPQSTTASTIRVLAIDRAGAAQGTSTALVSRPTVAQAADGVFQAGPADVGFAVDGGLDGHYVLVYEGATAAGGSVYVMGQ